MKTEDSRELLPLIARHPILDPRGKSPTGRRVVSSVNWVTRPAKSPTYGRLNKLREEVKFNDPDCLQSQDVSDWKGAIQSEYVTHNEVGH